MSIFAQQMPSNIEMRDVEFLANLNLHGALPPEIEQVIQLYKQSKAQMEHIKQSKQMETKVKQMCYDMMISVLEEQHLQAKSAIGFKPKPLRISKRKDHEGSSFVKMSSINEND